MVTKIQHINQLTVFQYLKKKTNGLLPDQKKCHKPWHTKMDHLTFCSTEVCIIDTQPDWLSQQRAAFS